MSTKTKIGVIGCGNISGIYLQADKVFEILDTVACADIVMEKAQAQAEKHHIARACTVDELLADPEIEIVVNLTIPNAHDDVAMAVLEAGKSVYNEKPLTITREEGQALLAAAKAKGVRVGGAPDTFLGGGIQTCRKLIDDGWIGEPVGATAFMMCHGHESWHPDPGVLLQGRRRADVRHGTVLPHRAGQPDGAGKAASAARPASPSPHAPSPASR